MKCVVTNPPGKKIYTQPVTYKEQDAEVDRSRITNSISIFEIKGDEHKLYCQNLCLIAKLFLDHKSIYFDVSPFKFYALTENDKNGKHLVAYFSKVKFDINNNSFQENSSISEFNLACIMVLPPYQRKGYGQFLISMSYYFSNCDGRICTPETPLSDLGKISYKAYWTNTILDCLLKHKGNLSLKELGEQTGIKNEDVITTLNDLNMVSFIFITLD